MNIPPEEHIEDDKKLNKGDSPGPFHDNSGTVPLFKQRFERIREKPQAGKKRSGLYAALVFIGIAAFNFNPRGAEGFCGLEEDRHST